ncbi:MAG: class I SAM-dependent methyltransferase [Saprospiraceae bacterium]
MDNQILKNEKIWDKLVQNNVLCSRPKYHLTPETAKAYLKNSKYFGEDLEGKNVLCLASGGGQQSFAFALLKANVTVLDFSAEQLKKDQLIAEKIGKNIRIVKSDMRDLTLFDKHEFDIIYQPYSINYIPEVEGLFDQIENVLKPNGFYDLMFHNPFVHGTWKDGAWGSQWNKDELWREKGYPLWQPYKDGALIQTVDPNWNFTNLANESVKIESPQEYKHTLSTIINGLVKRKFEILNLKEETGSQENTIPGTWEHYKSCAPPWIYLISQKRK